MVKRLVEEKKKDRDTQYEWKPDDVYVRQQNGHAVQALAVMRHQRNKLRLLHP